VTAPSSPELIDVGSNFRDTRKPDLGAGDGGDCRSALKHLANGDAVVKTAMNV
jgi:hypothetical protein